MNLNTFPGLMLALGIIIGIVGLIVYAATLVAPAFAGM